MIPAWLMWAGAGLVVSAAIAYPLRLENRRAAWQEAADAWRGTAREEKKARTAWQGAFEGQKQSYRSAQETAKRIALEEKQRDLRNYRTIAERADNADQELARYRALAERYARANRLRGQGAGTARRDAGATDPAGAGNPATSGDGPGGASDVVVSRADFDTLVDSAIRLKAVNKWGDDLLAQGLAVRAKDTQ